MPSGYKSGTNNRPHGERLGPYNTGWKGSDLRKARIAANLTQDELAAIAGCSRRTVIRAEEGSASEASIALLCSKVF